MKAILFSFLLISFSAQLLHAGEGLEVGDSAPVFKLKNVNGEMVSLTDYSQQNGVIVIFTCNHCPFSKAYEDRIKDLHSKYSEEGYPVVAINPNDVTKVPEDSYENMQKRSKEKDFGFPYLYDESQSIARQYGAARTPHVYLLTSEGESFTVAYIGAIDNNVKDAAAADEKYVENAIKDLQEGNAVKKSFTKAIGCTIKWKDQ